MPQNTFQTEQNKALSFFLDSIYQAWSFPRDERDAFINRYRDRPERCFLELFLTQECNQKCEYCYLQKNGEGLYPTEIRDKELMLKNLDIYLNYLLENNLHPPKIDLFSGEIWGYPLGNAVFDRLLKAIKAGLKTKTICIPANLSFCRHKNLIEIIDYYIEEFRKENVYISFSCSMDGLYLDKINRPCHPGSIDFKEDEYYQNIFDFCKRHNYGFHPMISSIGIEHQKENYKIWIEKLHEIFPTEKEFKDHYGHIMQLEVRDNNWSEENIKTYLEWLDFVIEVDAKEYFNGNVQDLLLDNLGIKKVYTKSRTYMPYHLGIVQNNPTCTAGKMLCVRLGDLAIAPCHRTSYDKFLFGNYVVENNKVVGVEAKNISLMNAWYRTGNITKPKCDACAFNSICLRGCFGAQYEANQEILYPCETVCNFFYGKYTYLIDKYEKYVNLNEYSLKDKDQFITTIFKIKETEEYKKWHKFTQKII